MQDEYSRELRLPERKSWDYDYLENEVMPCANG